MKVSHICALPVALALSACSGGKDPTNSFFGTAVSSTSFANNLDDARTARFVNSSNEGYVYQVGTNSSGLAGQAGLLPGTAVTAWSPTGTATFTGTFQATEVRNITVSNNIVSGLPSAVSDNITLTANFGNNTLTGTSNQGRLVVNGSVSGSSALSGSVTLNGVSGTLSGLAGSDQTYGVFHGNNDSTIFAGGFAAYRIP